MLSRFGAGFCVIVFNSLIFLGAVISFMGIRTHNFWLMIIGRGVFGLGAEAIIISQSTMAEKWFAGKFLSLAIGLNCFVDLSAATLQDYIIPRSFIITRNMEVPYFLIISMAFTGFMVAVVYYFTDSYAMTCKPSKKRKIRGSQIVTTTRSKLKTALDLDKETFDSERDTRNSIILDKKSRLTSSIIEVRMSDRPSFGLIRKPVFTFSHVDHLGTLYWILVVIFAFLSMSYYQFMNFTTPFLQKRFNYPYGKATELVTLI